MSLEESNKLLKAAQELNKTEKERIAAAERRLKMLKEEADIFENKMVGWNKNFLEDMRFEEELQRKKLALLKQEQEIRDRLKDQAQELAEGDEEEQKLAAQILEYSKMTLVELQEQSEAINDSIEGMKELIDKAKELNDEIEDGEDSFKKMVDHTNRAEAMMASLGKKSILFSVNLGGIAKKMGEMFDPENIGKYMQAFKEQFNPINMMPSLALVIVEATLKMATAADEAMSSFAAATATTGEFNDEINQTQRELNLLGVSFEDSANSLQALLTQTSNYVTMSEEAQDSIRRSSALLSKVGVDAQSSAELFQIFTDGLGVADNAAGDMMTSMLLMGTEIGITATQMGKDFQSAAGTLAVYGPRSVGIFTKLAAAAKASGASIDSLLGMAAKFDTFSESAKTVAGLNALLGTQLSTTQMLMMTEEERVETVIRSLQAQGRSFKDLDRFQKKAIANVLGFKDLAEAEMILGMDMGQYDEYQEKMKNAEESQKKLQEAAIAAMPIATQLMTLFQEMAVDIMPLLELARDGISMLRDGFDSLSPGTKEMVKGVLLLAGAVSTLSFAFGPLLGTFTKIPGAGKAAGAAIAFVGKGIMAAGAALAPFTPYILGAAAIGGLIYALSQYAKSRPTAVRPVNMQTAATIENGAMIRTGRARSIIDGSTIQARTAATNVNVNSSMPDQIIVDVKDAGSLRGFVRKEAADVAAGKPGRTIGAGSMAS